jgi:small subunit ribosomal protein S6
MDRPMRPYELMYLCPPTVDEERLGAVSERMQQAIATLGGKVEKVVPYIKRRLAYEVAHHRDGQYGVVEFALPPAQARELERTIRLTEDILRHLVVRRDE